MEVDDGPAMHFDNLVPFLIDPITTKENYVCGFFSTVVVTIQLYYENIYSIRTVHSSLVHIHLFVVPKQNWYLKGHSLIQALFFYLLSMSRS